MKTATASLALVVLLSASGAARAESEPEWSLGAGLGGTFTSLGTATGSFGSSNYGLDGFNSPGITPNASLEHRVGPGTWLLLGVTGNVAKRTTPLPSSQTGTFTTATTSGGAAVALGVRRYLTQPGTLIGVSVQVAATAGVQGIGSDYTTVYSSNGAGTPAHASATAFDLGVTAGLALDKELTDRLSLRLSAMLVSATYAKTTTSPTEVSGATESFGAALLLSPDLELRLAF